MSTRGEPIYLDGNDDMARVALTRVNTTTGEDEAATGLTGLTFRVAATENGSAINAALSVAAAEIGTTGEYYAVLQGSDLTTYLATYAGKDVYQVFGDGLNVNVVVVRQVLPARYA